MSEFDERSDDATRSPDENDAELEPGDDANVAGQGPLLDLEEKKAAKLAHKIFDQQNAAMEKRTPRWKANRMRREGITGVRVFTDPDTGKVTIWAPPGATSTPPAMNKPRRLCERVLSNLFADPPVPECAPASDSDEDREAAEYETRTLQDIGSEANLDDLATIRESTDIASDCGSGFRRYYVDPVGGGHQPREITAHPDAQTVGDAAMRDVPQPDGTTARMPWDGPSTQRYVAKAPEAPPAPTYDPENYDAEPAPPPPSLPIEQRSLTDNKAEAEQLPVPVIRCEVLSGFHVRLVPETASSIKDAEGAFVQAYATLGSLRKLCPDVIDAMGNDELRTLVKFRPAKNAKDILPAHVDQDALDRGTDGGRDKPPPDDTLVYTLTAYYDGKRSGEYPKGCYAIFAGGKVALYRGPLIGETTTAEGQRDEEKLDIPIDQVKQFTWGQGDPYGYGMMDHLGPGGEILATLRGYGLEHVDRFIRRKVFVPLTSTYQPKNGQAPTGTFMYINKGGEPTYEQVPDFPQFATDMMASIQTELDDESGLAASAQGQHEPGVESGLHAQQLIEQTGVGLSGLKQAVGRALTRGWRIQAQLIRTNYPAWYRFQWLGEENGYKAESWSVADLGGTKDIQVQKGSFTMMSPSAKAAVAQSMLASGLPEMTQDQLQRVITGNVGGLLGLQDNPHLLRVRQQIATALKGVAKGITDPMQLMQAVTALWAPRPNDEEPKVAAIRHEELSRAVSGIKFAKLSPGEQQAMGLEFNRMRLAAGVYTMNELAQQAAQAAQQQAMTAAASGKGPSSLHPGSSAPATAVSQSPHEVKEPAEPGQGAVHPAAPALR